MYGIFPWQILSPSTLVTKRFRLSLKEVFYILRQHHTLLEVKFLVGANIINNGPRLNCEEPKFSYLVYFLLYTSNDVVALLLTVCTVTDKWNNKLEQRITEFTWKITQKKNSSLFWHYFDRIKREDEYFISNVQPWYIIQILFKASLDSLDLVFRSISKVIELWPLELEDLQTSDLFFMQKQQITFS